MKCFKKTEGQSKMRFFPSKISDFIKKMKPVVKFMTNRHRTNSVTPSTCNYDIKMAAESEKADSRIDFLDVHFKFVDEVAENKANEDSESYENERNEQLENRFLKIGAEGKSQTGTTYSAAPVRFFVSECGELMWAPLADADIRCRGDLSITECQKPGIQSPIGVF